MLSARKPQPNSLPVDRQGEPPEAYKDLLRGKEKEDKVRDAGGLPKEKAKRKPRKKGRKTGKAAACRKPERSGGQTEKTVQKPAPERKKRVDKRNAEL